MSTSAQLLVPGSRQPYMPQIVVAENFAGVVEYVSPILPAEEATSLARALRELTRLRVIVEEIPAQPSGEPAARSDAN
jgi:hypothetical protein